MPFLEERVVDPTGSDKVVAALLCIPSHTLKGC